MLVRLFCKLFVNPINIPLRRFAYAARRCPPSKGELLVHDYPIKISKSSSSPDRIQGHLVRYPVIFSKSLKGKMFYS